MAVIKSYTDIEQSKKLAEILPPESADACWTNHLFGSILSSWRFESTPPQEYKSLLDRFAVRGYLIEPAWSTGALAKLLPNCEIIHDTSHAPFDKTFAVLVNFTNGSSYKTCYYESLFEAVYECICKMIQDGWSKKKLKIEKR